MNFYGVSVEKDKDENEFKDRKTCVRIKKINFEIGKSLYTVV